MPQARVMSILKSETGLPEDVFVNTFHFTTTAALDASHRLQVAGRVHQFFTEGAASEAPVSQYLSGVIPRTDLIHELRVYDLADSKPRPPVTMQWTVAPRSGTTNMPNEVACCLSFYASRSLPRNRGRVYIGPLSSGAVEEGIGDIRPTQAFREALAAAAVRMSEPTDGIVWCVRSEMDSVLKPITGGWVDHALDTVRKRGIKPTGRDVWGVPSGVVG